jgi:hypothetical protein
VPTSRGVRTRGGIPIQTADAVTVSAIAAADHTTTTEAATYEIYERASRLLLRYCRCCRKIAVFRTKGSQGAFRRAPWRTGSIRRHGCHSVDHAVSQRTHLQEPQAELQPEGVRERPGAVGYEHRSFKCLSCPWTERRLAFMPRNTSLFDEPAPNRTAPKLVVTPSKDRPAALRAWARAGEPSQ